MAAQQNRVADRRAKHAWSWFTDKVLPGIFTTVSIAVLGSAWATYTSVQEITGTVRRHEAEIIKINNDLAALRSSAITRAEILETIKRIEQQMEITMLRAGVKPEHVKVGG